MSCSDIATEFIESLSFETLVVWADILKVPHDEDQWIDDDYPDKEDELRVAVAEAMLKVGKKDEPFKGKEINPLPLGGG